MYATVCKQFTFAASHQLPNHDGPCHDLHGHTYRLEVMLTGRVKPPNGDPDEGMCLDFTELKEIYERRIAPRVDHKHLNESLAGVLPETNIEKVEVTTLQSAEPEYVDGHGDPVPTSEEIAAWIWRVFDHELRLDATPKRRVTIRLWESPTSYAEVGPTPWRNV